MIKAPPRIFLLGLRGTGKSTIAPLLAERLAWNWCDMDAELERRAGQSVREMFARLGESGFRQRESDLLREICSLEQVVVATGGGIVLKEENRRMLRQTGTCIWLRASLPVLVARLHNDPRSATLRPALTDLPLAEEMALLLAERAPLYQSCAHLVVDTDTLGPTAIADLICQRLMPTSAGIS